VALPPVALYVHWPYCARICPYCDFNVVCDRGRGEEQSALFAAMRRDLAEQAARLGPRNLVSVFFGGGTPSLMDPAWAGTLVEDAARLFTPAPDLEITLEANPTDAEAARFAGFAAAGVQRLSLGLQSLDDEALRFLGRNHGADEGRRAAEAAAARFPRLSLDLIYARPGQTPEAWAAELDEAAGLGAEHVSPYQLTIEAGTAFDRAVRRGAWAPPEGDAAADLWDATQAVLEARGFDAYEVSNHARGEAARSRHNLAIWRGAEYLGVGPGAHGRIELDGVRTATRGAPRIADYLARVGEHGLGFDTAEALSPDEAREERVLLGLRIREGVPAELVPADRVQDLAAAGLLERSGERVRATDAGRLLLDRVIAELLV
jgi:oxygen-independent coproporphyrinogen-3 oxidase